MRKALPIALLLAFIFVTLFSVMLVDPMSHGMDCPFATGCMTAIEHIKHWQYALLAIVAELLILAAIISFTGFSGVVQQKSGTFPLYRRRPPQRPTLFQDLFSRGILNRKEPYHS